ncbi:hypothetical protein AB8B21_05660 [Tardiphaga sp. 866_E4_N2_1]|jgi:hypothetical protein|uniref:hypothetical protein n=1 Tax=unclassified Tardiphaga TaxID=2631404 RepID=UPI001E379274|nr:hypothetical protein [Tardiphaga sp. 37S4]UFS77208.1 hypothetical protein LPB73_07480 [Tardiphaga sp. 37S4]
MTDKKPSVDWDEIKRDYLSGSMSNRELAAWYSISEGAIRKRAKKEGWVKSGTQPEVRTEPQTITIVQTPVTPETTSPEAIVGRGRNLTLRLLDELDATTSKLGELEMMIDTSIDGEDADQQRQALKQAVSLKQRAEVLKSLALAAKTLNESGAGADNGKKAQRQRSAEQVAQPGSKYAPPSAPKTVSTH